MAEQKFDWGWYSVREPGVARGRQRALCPGDAAAFGALGKIVRFDDPPDVANFECSECGMRWHGPFDRDVLLAVLEGWERTEAALRATAGELGEKGWNENAAETQGIATGMEICQFALRGMLGDVKEPLRAVGA